jgi:hypothetical protein
MQTGSLLRCITKGTSLSGIWRRKGKICNLTKAEFYDENPKKVM